MLDRDGDGVVCLREVIFVPIGSDSGWQLPLLDRNQNFIESIWVKRNTPRHVKEAVFHAMARNNALY